jgi:hypothetical protein
METATRSRLRSGVLVYAQLRGFSVSISQSTGVLWRHAGFMRLWAAQAISTFGARIARTGLPLAAVLTVHARPGEIGLLAALTTAP